jgi:arginyl-tRNA synthetase
MTRVDGALANAARLRASLVGEEGYALAYGSHAGMPAARDSDLDLLFVGPPLHGDQLDRLVQGVVALHDQHGLRLDTEVDYDLKLHASLIEVDAALALRGFTVSATGNLCVPSVVVAPWFLNSAPFKLRLVLNSLSTPHIFLGGNINLYQRHCSSADRAVALVALSLLDPGTAFTMVEAVAALVTAADGATGKDFLGYPRGPVLYSTVHRGLARLTAEQIVRTADGVHFEQHQGRRRALVAALHGPPAERSDAPGTMGQEQGGIPA